MSRRQFKISRSPWITKRILVLIKRKNQMYAQYLKQKSLSIYAKYKKYRNKLTHIKEISKDNYYRNLFCENNHPLQTWKQIN